jgi:8-oxo-dGTP pyrophosphatase MutT (NUDIX family)
MPLVLLHGMPGDHSSWAKVTQVAISPPIAWLRTVVGHDLLLLPSVAVFPVDDDGSVLLVPQAGSDNWSTLGGAVEIGESPAQAAVRESYEELGIRVQLTRLLDVLGGPGYKVTYPNGDQVAYVVSSYEARIVEGAPFVNDGELGGFGWFAREELPGLPLSRFTRTLPAETGIMPG